MTAPVLASAECAIAELALVLLLGCSRLAGSGRRRVARHLCGRGDGVRLWPCVVLMQADALTAVAWVALKRVSGDGGGSGGC
jgi:hypothetical protein